MSTNDRYIIVTTESLVTSLHHLMQQKQARGYTVTIITCEHLKTLFPDMKLYDAIRNYVLDSIKSIQGKSCLLLVGDKHEVPGYPIYNPNSARFDILAIGYSNQLIQMMIKAGEWKNWKNRGGNLDCDPTVVSWGMERMDIFALDMLGRLMYVYYELGSWGTWQNLEGGILYESKLTTKPAAVTWGRDRIDVFSLDQNRHLMHLSYDNGWGDWEDLGGDLRGQPAVVSWGPGRIDVFAWGNQNNHLMHLWYANGQWGNWEDLGGNLASIPAAVSWGEERLDIFARGTNNHLFHLWHDKSGWGTWRDKGGSIRSQPVAVSWDNYRLDIFAMGQQMQLMHLWYSKAGWGNWADKGGRLFSFPTAISCKKGRFDVFALNEHKRLIRLYYDNEGWSNWEQNIADLSWTDHCPAVCTMGALFDSDVYYSMYSENDITPRLLTGRISSSNPTEVADICNLLVSYPLNYDYEWRGKVILAGWVPRGPSESNLTLDPGWACVKEIGDCYKIIKQFEDYENEPEERKNFWDVRGNTSSSLHHSIAQGAAILRYVGHGEKTYWDNVGTRNSTINQHYNASQVNDLNVNGMTPLVLSVACLTGDIETPVSFAEMWQIRLKAIGIYASDDPSSGKFVDGITQLIFRQIVRYRKNCIGQILNNALNQLHNEYPDRYDPLTVKMYRYLGDPDTYLTMPAMRPSSDVAVSWSGERIDIFSRGSADQLMHLSYDRGWKQWADWGGRLKYDPAAVSWGRDRIDVFGCSHDNDHLLHMWYNKDGWRNWVDKGGSLASTPAVVSWDEGRLDIFARGKNNHLLHLWYQAGWGSWEDKGGNLDSAPAVASWGKGRLDIFAKDHNNHLLHLWYSKAGWGSWDNKGGNLTSEPAVVSWGEGRLDIFAKGQNNHLLHLWYSKNGWGSWEDKGGNLISAPAVVSWDEGRLDVFARGHDNHLWHIWYDNGWGSWRDLGGIVMNKPAVVSWAKGRLDIFTRDNFTHLMHIWYSKNWKQWEDKTPG